MTKAEAAAQVKQQERVLKAVIPQVDSDAGPGWRKTGWARDRLAEAAWSLFTPTGLLALFATAAWLISVILKATRVVPELPVGWDPVVWAWGIHVGNAGVRTVSRGAAAGMILRRPAPGILDEGDEA